MTTTLIGAANGHPTYKYTELAISFTSGIAHVPKALFDRLK